MYVIGWEMLFTDTMSLICAGLST